MNRRKSNKETVVKRFKMNLIKHEKSVKMHKTAKQILKFLRNYLSGNALSAGMG
jgi:hypothetical protein